MRDDLREAYEHCRRVARTHARNFYYAFLTLPAPRRRSIYAVYAFCRLCDDIVDEPLSAEEKVLRLGEVREALDRAYRGEPQGPLFTALAHTVRAYSIPRGHFEEVIRGVEMDITRTRYRTFEDLRLYCYRVASAVGLLCIRVFGYRDGRAQEYAVDLGLAMQLTNILRDIKEDAARGRLYIPLEDLERFGCPEEHLLEGVLSPPAVAVMRLQAERARSYFERGKRLIPLLPLRSRACPAVLGGLYSRILRRIEERGYDVFSERVRLSTAEKLLLTLRLWSGSLLPHPALATVWS